MSLKDSISDELKRSPIATISGAAAVIIAALSLWLAWMQYPGSTSNAPQGVGAIRSSAEFSLGNVALAIAYFLAVTVAAALLLRAIGRKHDITALFLSIPLIAFTNFTVILLIYIAPPRPLSPRLFESAHDLVFYASAAIVVAFCGHAVLRDLASTNSSKKDESESKPSSSNDGIGLLFMALLLLAVWSWLVFAGQTRLTRTLLPEVTHPPDAKSSSMAPNNTVERDAPKAARPSP
jgi:glucan phosphoethanolaminetransferase (alkaline phosphatase superfamily)